MNHERFSKQPGTLLQWLRRFWEPWGILILLALATVWLMRGWLSSPLPSSPRQETLTELNITASFLDDLRAGHVLVPWNPREFAGYPWLRFMAYPLYLGLAAASYLTGLALTRVVTAYMLLVFWGSSVAMYAYARRVTPHRPPVAGGKEMAVLPGTRSSLFPPATGGRWGVAPVLAALIYLWFPAHSYLGVEAWIHATFYLLFPLALYLIERMVRAPRGRERYRWALWLGAALAAFVVVTIEYTVLAAPLVVIYLLVREGALLRRREETWPGALSRLVLVGAVALGLAAFFVVPAATSMAGVGIHNKHASGSTFGTDLLGGYSLSASLVLRAIAARTHLPLPYGELPAGLATAYWGVTWYPGAVATALVAVGIALAVWRRRQLLLVALWALAILMVLGPNLPHNPFTAIPVLGRLTPYRAALFVGAFGALLAGAGGAWLCQWIGERVGRVAGRAQVTKAGLVVVLAALVCLDFAPASSAFVGVQRYFSPQEEAAQAWLRADSAGQSSRYCATGCGLRYWEPNLLPRDDYRTLLDSTLIGLPRFWGYYDNGAPLYAWQLYNWGDMATDLRLSSVRYALLGGKTASDPGALAVLKAAGFERVDWGIEGIDLWEDLQPLPYARAYTTAALAVSARPEETVRLLPALVARGVALVNGASADVEDYDAAALVPYRDLFAADAGERRVGDRAAWLAQQADRARVAADAATLPAGTVLSGERVQWTRPAAGEIHVRVDLPQRALVTIGESWYPDWQVTVDGRPAELLRANYAFQGTWVEAGQHEIVFRYRRPALDNVALAVSGLVLLAWIAGLAYCGARVKGDRRAAGRPAATTVG